MLICERDITYYDPHMKAVKSCDSIETLLAPRLKTGAIIKTHKT